MINKAKSLLPITLVGLIVITAAEWRASAHSSNHESDTPTGDADQVLLEFSCKTK